MKYRRLGNTDMDVSILSFGCSAIGGVYSHVETDTCIEAVRSSLNEGVNYLDTSPYYGNHRSEINTGLALKGIPRDSYYLATKAGKYGDRKEDYDFSYDRIIKSCDESLKRLQVDYLDVLQLHDFEYHKGHHIKQVIEEGIPALNELKKQGKIRYTGITAYPVDVFKQVIDEAAVDVILNHNHYSLNDQRLLTVLAYFNSKKVGVVSASPLASGLLTSQGVPSWHTASDYERNVVNTAIEFCKKHGTTLEKLAIQFSVSNEAIPTVLISSANPSRMKKNIEWVNETPDFELIESVIKILKPIENTDWGWG